MPARLQAVHQLEDSPQGSSTCLRNGMEESPEHSTTSARAVWSVTPQNRAFVLPVPTSVNEGIRVCHYLGYWNQGISLWDLWGPFPTGATLKDCDSDQRLESQFKGLLPRETLHDHLPITHLKNRVGFSLSCAFLTFNSASHCSHTILYRGSLRELKTEL